MPLVQAGRTNEHAVRTAIRTFADELTSHWLDVRGPGLDGSQYLKITNVPGVLCDLAVRDDGTVEWEYRLCQAQQVDPARVIEMALAMLGAEAAPGVTGCHRDLTLKAAVGQALARCGLHVSHVLYRDDHFYQVHSEIEISNLLLPDRGKVQVADDGSVRWECRFRDAGGQSPGISPKEVAETIATALGHNTAA